jgi:hypothetical protein
LLQILLVAALEIKTRYVPTVISSINSLLLQYCKASRFFVANFNVLGGGATVRFAPVVPWAKAGPVHKAPKRVWPQESYEVVWEKQVKHREVV